MQSYGKICTLGTLSQFHGWMKHQRTSLQRLPNDTLCYLWHDFSVGTSPLYRKDILVTIDTPEWKAICETNLNFVLPATLQPFLQTNHFVNIPTQQQIVPLTGAQAWYFARDVSNPHHFNNAILLEIPLPIDLALLEQAIYHVIKHYSALRARFVQYKQEWHQFILAEDNVVPFSIFDLSVCKDEKKRLLLETIAAHFETSLNLFHGPILQIVFFAMGNLQPSRLLIIIHHQIIDGFSFPLISIDLLQAYQQLSMSPPVQLEPVITDYKDYTSHIMRYAQSESLIQELDHWLTMPWSKVLSLPLDYPEGQDSNIVSPSRYVSTTLSSEETRVMLQTLQRTHQTHIRDILLTVLLCAFEQLTLSRALQVSIVYNARTGHPALNGMNLQRTIGNLSAGTELMNLDLGESDKLEEQVQSIERQLNSAPGRGTGIIMCQTAMRRGQFILEWEYSRNLHRQETIEQLSQRFLDHLRLFVLHSASILRNKERGRGKNISS